MPEEEPKDMDSGFDEEEEKNLDKWEEESKEKGLETEPSSDHEHYRPDRPARDEPKCVKNAYLVENFAIHLLKVMKQYRTMREQRFKEHFKCEGKELNSINIEFPPFQRTQAIYAYNYFIARELLEGRIDKNIRVEYYDDADEVSPTYETLKVSRTKHEVFLTVGYQFIIYKGTPLIQDLYFTGSCRYVRIHFRKKDMDVATDFMKEARDFMKEKNIFKGEKLLFAYGGHLTFLEYPKLNWGDVVLSPNIKKEFDLNLITPLVNEEQCKTSGVPWRRGLMLGGLAGTGKTQVCRILCNELKGVTVIWATPKAVQGEDDIAVLFEAARYFAPTLLVIEDIDFIGTSRDFAQDPSLGELLTQLDGNDPNYGIFVIATTNRPEMLDSALANRPSRFDVLIEFKLPDEQSRRGLVTLFSKNMCNLSPQELDTLVGTTKELTGAQIKEIFVYAQLKAIESKNPISLDDVKKRAQDYKPKTNAEAYRQ
jgi:hypothetical protein